MQDKRIELRELTANDGMDVFRMAQEIGPGENGFVNGFFVERFEQFQEKLKRNVWLAKGIDLEPQLVPQTVYWFYVNDVPVGYGKLRHRLNDQLRLHGGHIGYVIRPSERGRGYAVLLLRELLRAADAIGLADALLTCDEHNTPSRRAIERNGGLMIEQETDCCRYLIRIGSAQGEAR